ncbi:DNA adenine methylase [Clostridium tyrobutyricum]|uniref:DNA adenine methylase n=1 Tax=Clostridium tyrobutyricum TaxID=1519 RepID=UPI001C380A72|nr:DNA adenine methylase [Clostridium tyrobutyricum]MBV4427340.1 DNA adenine methylase [Clostridium tyrobutyricum]MBV4442325.1 DNA adenine methylase [Clostridium tyrobutyricum]
MTITLSIDNKKLGEKELKRSINYLGSKFRLLPQIKELIDYVDKSQGKVCDLFAGSGMVSRYLSMYRSVMACDIQEYSCVLTKAQILPIEDKIDATQFAEKCMNSKYANDFFEVMSEIIVYEQECFDKAKSGVVEFLYEIIEKGSLISYEKQGEKYISDKLESVLKRTINKMKNKGWLESTDSMLTRYYGGIYFSYYQTIVMDILSHEIFKYNGIKKDILLAALISTASEIVNTVGKQFAQPLKVRDKEHKLKKSLYKKIQKDRTLDTVLIYIKWLKYYLDLPKSNKNNLVLRGNFDDALDKLEEENVKIVYADPPYTRYHYSRYYHVLESICLRDNPEISITYSNGLSKLSRGIYRNDRYQSEFSIKTKAEKAFEELFKKICKLNIPLILSYSPFEPSQAVTPRLQTIEQLVNKAKEYFNYVEVVSPGKFKHNKLNTVKNNLEASDEAELLILCK